MVCTIEKSQRTAIYLPWDGYNHEPFLIREHFEQIRKKPGQNELSYAIPRSGGEMDFFLGMTRGQDRVIIANPTMKCAESAQREDLTERLVKELVPGTILHYLSINGEGDKFLQAVPENRRSQVKIVPKTIESLSYESVQAMISA